MTRPLREIVTAHLDELEGWRRHPAHQNTYLEWEDLRANPEEDTVFLPTDLAALRQMTYEWQDFRSSDAKPSDEHTQREPAEDATGGTAGPGRAPD